MLKLDDDSLTGAFLVATYNFAHTSLLDPGEKKSYR
jgi:hypothetical protein